MEKLWASIVGSHAWNMQTSKSDLDVLVVVSQDMKDFLVNRRVNSKFVEKVDRTTFEKDFFSLGFLDVENDIEIDVTTWEIGSLVDQIRKGNMNAYWVIFSPKMFYFDEKYGVFCRRLQEIVIKNPVPSLTWKSVKGMVKNTVRLIEKHPEMLAKKMGMIERVLLQFDEYLKGVFKGFVETDYTWKQIVDGSIIRFDVERINMRPEDVDGFIEKKDGLIEASKCFDQKASLSESLDDFLLGFRLHCLNSEFSHGETGLYTN